MSFTVATILAFNGERGIAETAFGEKIYFDKTAVPADERHAFKPGLTVVHTDGCVELATSSFIHFQDDVRELHTSETTITEL
jgi:hypothetical protein